MITRLSPGEVNFWSRRDFVAVSIVTLGSSLNAIRCGQTPQQIDSWRRTSSLGVKAKIVARSGRRFEVLRAILPCRVKTMILDRASELARTTADATVFWRASSRMADSA